MIRITESKALELCLKGDKGVRGALLNIAKHHVSDILDSPVELVPDDQPHQNFKLNQPKGVTK